MRLKGTEHVLDNNDCKNWAGFKTGGIDSVTERLGGSIYRQFLRGGSDHVNV